MLRMNRGWCGVLAGWLLWAAGAQAADLVGIYRQAQASDARFAAASAQREAGQEKRVQARAGLLPSLSAGASTQWNSGRNNAVDLGYNSNGWTLQLTQPLFRWQNWIQARQGTLQAALADLQFEVARQELALRVAEAYFDVLNAQDALAAVRQLGQAAAQQLALARASFEVGTVTVTDVHEAQSRFDLAMAQQIAADSALELARQNLAQIVGAQLDEALAPLSGEAILPLPEPADVGVWIDAAQNDGYPVQLFGLQADIAREDIARSRAAHYPTVDLVASHSHNSAGFGAQGLPTESHVTAVGVQLNVPLFQGGATQSRVREAYALNDKAQADLLDAQRAAALAARQAYLGVTNGLAQVRALEAAERSSRSALEANRLGYEVGVRINIDVLNAQSQLAETQQKLARARYDTLLAQLRLKAAAGLLDEAALEAVNRLLVSPAS